MNLNFEKVIKLVQQISFTTFLILCVAVMAYAVTRLYTDSRNDWDKVQLNSQKLELLDRDITLLIARINKLIDLLAGQSDPKLPALPNRGPIRFAFTGAPSFMNTDTKVPPDLWLITQVNTNKTYQSNSNKE